MNRYFKRKYTNFETRFVFIERVYMCKRTFHLHMNERLNEKIELAQRRRKRNTLNVCWEIVCLILVHIKIEQKNRNEIDVERKTAEKKYTRLSKAVYGHKQSVLACHIHYFGFL